MRSAPGDPGTRTGIDPDDRRPDAPDDPDGPEMRFPGADDLPEHLGERIEDGPGGRGIATGGPDLLPDVEIPEHTM